MTTRTPRHHAMVDFPQHQQRLWVVLEEDHEKVEKENARLRDELDELAEAAREKEKDYFQLQSEVQNLRAALAGQQAEPTMAKNAKVAATPSEDGREVPELVAYRSGKSGHVYQYGWGVLDPQPLMTVAQHERIVGAYRVALIQARSETPVMIDAQPVRQVSRDERAYCCDYAGCYQKAHPGTSLCLEHHTPKARAALAPVASQVGEDEREAFEANCRVPKGAAFSAERNNYWREDDEECCYQTINRYNAAWWAWQKRAALAPAAVVVVPEKKSVGEFYGLDERAEIRGFNAALDEVARLNRRAIPAGLVDVLISTIEGVVHDDRVPNEVSQECASVLLNARALLGKDGETRKCKDYGHGGHWCGAPDCWLRP